MAKIRRTMNLGDVDTTNPGVGHFIPDELVEFLSNAFCYAFCTVRVQVSGYRRAARRG